MQQTLEKVLLPLALAGAIGAAAPAVAADYIVRELTPRVMAPVPSGPLTLQDALAIASGIGVVTVHNAFFDRNFREDAP